MVGSSPLGVGARLLESHDSSSGEAFGAPAVRPVIDVYASQPNYWRHLEPIVLELRRRGHEVRVYASRPGKSWGPPLTKPRIRGSVVVTASWVDSRAVRPHRVVYVEHGAGQSYVGISAGGYAGAELLGHVVLFLAPSDRVAGAWRSSYPQAAVETVGSPALDQHLRGMFISARDLELGATTSECLSSAVEPRGRTPTAVPARAEVARGPRAAGAPPLVALTAHWPCSVCPETLPAMPRFTAAIAELPRDTIRLLGHAHPRDERRAARQWRGLGIEFEPDPDVVLARADLLVADNTSLLYEAAAVDTPVLVLNAPTYRRDVEHGLRFWSHVPGIQIDYPEFLWPGIVAALDDPPEARELRARAAGYAYAHLDGHASVRAADAIERVL